MNYFREITIPDSVLDDNRLSASTKILFGKIAYIISKECFCYVGNQYLDSTKNHRNANRYIAELKNCGYIKVEQEKDKKKIILINKGKV